MLVEVAVVSLVFAASPRRCEAGECVFAMNSGGRNITITANGSKESSQLYSATLEDALASDLGLIPDIRYVSVERAEHNLLVWIALDNPSEENREKVFQKQFDLIEGFPEISFDFNLISSRNRAHSDIASDAKLIYRRGD
jgi:hypothetical protein